MRINHTIIMLAAGLAMIALVGCGDSGSTTPEAQEWERSLEEIREAQAELERNLEELEAEISVRGTDDRPFSPGHGRLAALPSGGGRSDPGIRGHLRT